MGVCLIPGQGTKVLQAAQCSQKKGAGEKEKRIDWETWKDRRKGKIRMMREMKEGEENLVRLHE